ncbi:hypothetical protein EW145_g726 [Phellinidium pouzarii]|uniref:Uncharacterized protein n=1 Tax=Phellinidium pouzarii TaxID=167371 RepID=A0A4S4LJ39_9AGAM|nr:hypothetical protein EW145_g726 [Phellinidium pouzarii]
MLLKKLRENMKLSMTGFGLPSSHEASSDTMTLSVSSSCNLLIAGDLRRMTHASVAASMFASILSIVFGLLCRVNITPARLQFLVNRKNLFYFLYATPSLWGGGAALAFFVAICAYTWLEESTTQYGWEAKAAAIVMSCALIGNADACFFLGACVVVDPGTPEHEGEKALKEKYARDAPDNEGRNEITVDGLFGIGYWKSNIRSPFKFDAGSLRSNGTSESIPSQRGPLRSATFDFSSSVAIASPRART